VSPFAVLRVVAELLGTMFPLRSGGRFAVISRSQAGYRVLVRIFADESCASVRQEKMRSSRMPQDRHESTGFRDIL
jgi:hypothetical protein